MVNKYHKIVGGADRYALELTQMLLKNGHQVAFLSPKYSDDLPADYPLYSIRSGLTRSDWRRASVFRAARAYCDGIYNMAAAASMKRALKEFRPDIVHCHNLFYQISPSVVHVAHAYGIPVVQTLHDYQVVCASNSLFAQGKICEECRKSFFNILRQRCYNDSILASWMAFSARIVHAATGLYPYGIDHYIAPSRSVIDRIASFGLKRMPPISHVPHFVAANEIEPNYTPGEYALFFGGFIAYKGVETLLEAVRLSPCKLILAGSGPHENAIRQKIKDMGLDHATMVGFKSGAELSALIRNARVVIVPSEVYETFGLVVVEAYAAGKPVIAANIGALPELVTAERGVLFEPGNASDLASKLRDLFPNTELLSQMGRAGREYVIKNHDPKAHVASIVDIYKRTLDRYGKRTK
jgi:glycosyltransferase involved in cell wall biosynthesis